MPFGRPDTGYTIPHPRTGCFCARAFRSAASPTVCLPSGGGEAVPQCQTCEGLAWRSERRLAGAAGLESGEGAFHRFALVRISPVNIGGFSFSAILEKPTFAKESEQKLSLNVPKSRAGTASALAAGWPACKGTNTFKPALEQ